MAQFQYFVPGKNRLTLQQCRDHGIGYAFESNPHPQEVMSGPDGSRGVVLCASDERIGYYPDKQTWRKIPKNEHGIWCGVWNDALPGPEELQRPEQLAGEWMKCEDGNQWLVPHARRFEEVEDSIMSRVALPTAFGINDEGELVAGEVRPRFARLWDLAMQFNDCLIEAEGKGQTQFEFPMVDEAVEAAIAANYRVSLFELVVLQIYDNQMRSRALRILVDQDTWEQFYKKKLEQLLSQGDDSSNS